MHDIFAGRVIADRPPKRQRSKGGERRDRHQQAHAAQRHAARAVKERDKPVEGGRSEKFAEIVDADQWHAYLLEGRIQRDFPALTGWLYRVKTILEESNKKQKNV